MAQFTEKAIIESFIKLLRQTPLNKLTVREIVEDCGVSRNTFYYHFEDIYALLDATLKQQMLRCAEMAAAEEDSEAACRVTVRFISEQLPALRNIYTSMDRDYLERYLFDVLDEPLYNFIHGLPAAESADEQAVSFVARYHKYALVGFMLDWLHRGSNEELEEVIRRLALLFDHGVDAYLAKLLQLYSEMN